MKTQTQHTGTLRPAEGSAQTNGRLSSLAKSVIGSEILKIAGDIRRLVAEGKQICNLTVGDFSPTEFRPPLLLQEAIRESITRGETNYPPSEGVLSLRQGIRAFYRRSFGLDYPIESILVHGGSRPGIYGTFRTIVDPGDRIVYPVPSWNNNHYTNLVSGTHLAVPCDASTSFLPTADHLREPLKGARLLALNSPLNPTGTAFTKETLEEICDLVLEENHRRSSSERPLYVMYDQVYWMLTFGKTSHHDPVSLRPEMQQYTLLIDGISKAFASTGIRVGWTLGPPDIIQRMGNILAHVGAWAPRAGQTGTASLLDDKQAVSIYNNKIKDGVQARLDALYEGIRSMAEDGFPVTAIEPMGAIYLSVRFDLNGTRMKDGTEIRTNEEIRQYLLDKAQVAMVPFQGFGSDEETGWCRFSVGAVSMDDIRQMFPRLRSALERLKRL
ncbi:MAG: aminotransferase class I/II-fold pyridoxal phosphate-dependent enzyme [Ignavibacteria bacterium]|nr:aminotransferase class I/II-fold pyridoxal phosphate-dependent enzyme [Ignavibacteria bacterium]